MNLNFSEILKNSNVPYRKFAYILLIAGLVCTMVATLKFPPIWILSGIGFSIFILVLFYFSFWIWKAGHTAEALLLSLSATALSATTLIVYLQISRIV